MNSPRRLAIGSVYACAALAGLAPILAFAEWLPSIALWLALALTWTLNESGRLRHLPDWFTKHAVALPILGLTYLDFTALGTPLMALVTHLMCLLQVAKAVKRKTTGDLWTMYMISLLQVIAGAVVSLDILYFVLWGAYSAVSVCFLNIVLAQPAREDRTVGVHVAPKSTLFGRWLRLSGQMWLVVAIGTSFSFLFFPRDFGGLRQALHLRRNSERLAWSAGLMIPEGRALSTSGFSDAIDMGSLSSVVIDPTEALEVRFTRDGQPFWPEPEDIYLRGRSLDTFDGRRWTAEGNFAPMPGRDSDERPYWIPRRGSDSMRVEVKPIGDQGPTLLLPRPAWDIDIEWILRDRHGNLQREQEHDRPYSATCAWKPWESPQGRPVSTWWTHDWFELPFSPHADEYERLAEEITRNVPRQPHERALAISKWLSEHCAYTLQLEWQSNSDPVHEFLRRRRGYCVYFASTMAVLLRTLRIACRLVVGYAGGQRDERRGAIIIRRSDAHAWVEVPYDNRLWVPYDPTAGARILQARSGAVAGPGLWTTLRDTLDRNVLFYDTGRQRELIVSIGKLVVLGITSLTGWAAIVVLITIAAWYARIAARQRARAEATLRERGPIPIQTWPSIAYYRDMLLLLRARGIERSASLTPLEFVARVRKQRPELAEPVAAISELFEDERYGGRAADGTAAQRTLDDLKAAR